MSEHEHALPVEGCWRCDLKNRLVTLRHELDICEEPREGVRYEILANDPDLGVIVRATDLETGATGLGAADPYRDTPR